MIDFDAIAKEFEEINEKKRAWDKAFDRAWELWQLIAKHETEIYEWQNKKTVANEEMKK